MTSCLGELLVWHWANKSACPPCVVISTRSCEHVCMSDLVALLLLALRVTRAEPEWSASVKAAVRASHL